MKLKNILLSTILFCISFTSFALDVDINTLELGQTITASRKISLFRVTGYDGEKQQRELCEQNVSFKIEKTESGFHYFIILPEETSCISYSHECRDSFIDCLTNAFQNPETMKHYADRQVLSPEKAREKALNNANLHANNLSGDARPRFIVQKGDKVVGFVRVGGASDNPWAKEELAEGFLENGFLKAGDMWLAPSNNIVDEKGIGEIAILLEESETNKGLGRMIMTTMMKLVMPTCKRIGILYNNTTVNFVMSTVSADNLRSRSILKDHFMALNETQIESNYNGALKLYYIHEIPDADIEITVSK